ncbi:MAG: hypothetical protein RL522_3088 [Pseudomonadota bacterium]|jgi:predicted esterase YcpF (UPF0227 family)
MNQPVTHLLYLHGFRSSPRSAKAIQVARWVQERHPSLTWWCPQLPPSPREALALVMQGIAAWPRETLGVMGSSLGGFYATCVAEATGCRAVLLNPAVHPARDLARHIGEQSAWHDPSERFFFEPRFVDELAAITLGAVTRPERYYAVIAKGDEVLDWREMHARYADARIRLLAGSDHALSDFPDHIDEAMGFLGL